MEQNEQDKSEEPTPFKLRKAREKGQVARGMDLGFLSVIIAFLGFFMVFGGPYMTALAMNTRHVLSLPVHSHSDPLALVDLLQNMTMRFFWPLLALFAITITIVVFFEIVQLRGFLFSTHPLKPDFTKLNPAKGLKRLFSMKMLKETLKNIVKLVVYATVSGLVVHYGVQQYAHSMRDADRLVDAMQLSALRLLLAFAVCAAFFVVLDQIIARQEYRKQMRMSRREVTRENKDREGDPRLKQKRKSLHADFTQSSGNIADVAGADVVIVNPEHFAVALRYDPEQMEAPQLVARGRNHFALAIKQIAWRNSVTIIENRPLAQGLYKACKPGAMIPEAYYRDVVSIYLRLPHKKRSQESDSQREHSS
ncbi:MAG: EscU/YscU/HrcU family type III secretion system export apparatus switch protein [Pseudomonadota bacterium]